MPSELSAPEVADALELMLPEAQRVMSTAGLQSYLDGASALARLGRGPDPVVAFLEAMPPVVAECGEDVISDAVGAAMKVSSMTSGAVIAALFASLPSAARHLGDPDLVSGYLTLVHRLASTAPRGLRPMLGHLDELLSKLTLSGLRRWANFGAQAYRRDFDNLIAYFELESPDSRAVLETERRGVLFVGVQRRLNLYLRALWGRDFMLRPTEAEGLDFRPYVESRILHLPDAVDDVGDVPGLELYRGAAAHMAAHLMYADPALSSDGLSPAQMFFVALLEDARVEYRSIVAFPGLKRLWASLMEADGGVEAEHPSLPLLEGLAHQLLDATVVGDDPELDDFAVEFHARIGANGDDAGFSREMGLRLFQVFADRKAVPSLRLLERYRLSYRDDNRIVWHCDDPSLGGAATGLLASRPPPARYRVSPMMMAHTLDSELAGDDAHEIWTCSDLMRVYEDDLTDDAATFNELMGTEPVSDPFYYDEWDYQTLLYRPDWVTLRERRTPKGDPEVIDRILLEHKPIAQRIRRIIDLLAPAGVLRQRRLEDGDEIDLNAAVDAMVAIRMGEQPSPRITMRNVVRSRDLAVIVLLDLSESTNETIGDSDKTILQLTREAATLLATAIEGIGDPFAVHGFASDGRHDVRYYRLKDFSQPYDDEARARLAGMTGGLSTRMGAALRRAGDHLARRAERRKLILLVTDGEPADVDETDPQYLRRDAKKAVEELHSRGVSTYCLTLDHEADAYVKQIFGERGYTIIDHVDRLPEQLPFLFARLTS